MQDQEVSLEKTEKTTMPQERRRTRGAPGDASSPAARYLRLLNTEGLRWGLRRQRICLQRRRLG